VVIGKDVGIMSHHFADCAGTLEIGDGVTVAGRSTDIYTHQLSLTDGTVGLNPTRVVIGAAAYVGARCTLVACVVPPGAMVGAGAVVVRDHTKDAGDDRVLLAGNPATVRKVYPSADP
jgi:acetyltransferase-like isoleucine patch superfamily enzyme